MRYETLKALADLDVELTGKSYRDCANNAQQYKDRDVFYLMSNLYYLSDGGYSRLRIAEDFTAHLAMGARAEIQFNWEYADRAIQAVNDELAEESPERDEMERNAMIDTINDLEKQVQDLQQRLKEASN